MMKTATENNKKLFMPDQWLTKEQIKSYCHGILLGSFNHKKTLRKNNMPDPNNIPSNFYWAKIKIKDEIKDENP